ncbi:hypothetical protein J4E93_001774 [Alternaria ventricosa]|uniref:uncharacterized protein n=1 Tax=Alternaria ventricosa TaxID=1187951 RepID=UPI0020C4593B|nr:uncharacterized protein J4E93_001774 [Alternaria ventricosa]KAI4654006.1 hypothetical protein J4E93_001774 [Alternaria ventricosa]
MEASVSQRPNNREIRVLDLLPGCPDDTIECHIRNISVDGDAQYEALSYVWGDAVEKRSLQVSGSPINISPNLHDALRRLRYPDQTRTLWVDQICINQWDMEEKASQVALMREIYSKCAHCILWLGEIQYAEHGINEADTHAVFAFFEAVANRPAIRNTSAGEAYDLSSKGVDPEDGLPTLFQEGAAGVTARKAFAAFAMYGNTWWERIWTIQESILPCSAEFRWGPLSVSRRNILLVVQHLRKRQLKWWNHSHRYRQFSAGGRFEREQEPEKEDLLPKVSSDWTCLSLPGLLVDQVEQVNSVYEVSDEEYLDYRKIRNVMSDARQLVAGHDSYKRDPAQSCEALWRTMIGDLVMAEYPIERAKATHASEFLEIERALSNEEFPQQGHQSNYPPHGMSGLFESLCGMVPNHAFFITKRGYLGMGPPTTSPGDQIWVFYNGNVPFVMRKRNKEELENGYHELRLVGDAYVHGIMDGQAISDEHVTQTAQIY